MTEFKESKHDELIHRVISCAMEVHCTMGNGFTLPIYREALAVELSLRKISFLKEVDMPLFYKGTEIGIRHVDFYIGNALLVEVVTASQLDDNHVSKGMNFLEAFNLETGLIINFGSKSLQFKRLINHKYKPESVKV